jgi:hypothetical protein
MMFPEFSDNARVWVYQSDRPLNSTEQSWVQENLTKFVGKWAAHGAKLKAEGQVLSPYHIALAVEGDIAASGCSIDASVRFVKEVGIELKVDFFNRLKLLVEIDGAHEIVPFSDLGDLTKGLVYNPMIENLQQLRNSWKVAPSELLPRNQ